MGPGNQLEVRHNHKRPSKSFSCLLRMIEQGGDFLRYSSRSSITHPGCSGSNRLSFTSVNQTQKRCAAAWCNDMQQTLRAKPAAVATINLHADHLQRTQPQEEKG